MIRYVTPLLRPFRLVHLCAVLLIVSACSSVSDDSGSSIDADGPADRASHQGATGQQGSTGTESRAAAHRVVGRGLVAAAPQAASGSVRYAPYVARQGGSGRVVVPRSPAEGPVAPATTRDPAGSAPLAASPAPSSPAHPEAVMPESLPDEFPSEAKASAVEPKTVAAVRESAPPPSVMPPSSTPIADSGIVPPAPPVTSESLAASLPDSARTEAVASTSIPAPDASMPDGRTPDGRVASARDEGPDAPPRQVTTQSPSAARTVAEAPPSAPPAPPAASRPPSPMATLDTVYQQRLAQFGGPSADSAYPAAPSAASLGQETERGAPVPLGALDDQPIHLIPPSESAPQRSTAADRASAAVPAATFQVAQLQFQDRSPQLTRGDRSALADVTKAYKKSKGKIRILSYGAFPDPWARADAAAAVLVRNGIPAEAILIGVDEGATGTGGATVFLDIF